MRWRRHVLFALLALSCAVAQITLVPRLWEGAQPDLLLAIVILLGLFQTPATGSIYAFGIGYLNDLLTGGVMGLFMFERVLMFTLGNRLSRQFYAKSAPAQFVIIAILTVADVLLTAVLVFIFGHGNTFRGSLAYIIPLRSFVTALAGMPLFFIIRLIFETSGGIEGIEKSAGRMKKKPLRRPPIKL